MRRSVICLFQTLFFKIEMQFFSEKLTYKHQKGKCWNIFTGDVTTAFQGVKYKYVTQWNVCVGAGGGGGLPP